MREQASPKADERQRRSERVLLRIPIEVEGTGPDGQPFKVQTFTLVINRHGARVSLKHLIRPDDRLTIRNLQTKMACPFRVVGRTSDSLGEGPEWGVECLEPEVNFWGIDFPSKASAPPVEEMIDALLECSKCSFRELAKLTLEQYRTLIDQSSLSRHCTQCDALTEWSFGFVEAEPEPLPAQSPPTSEPWVSAQNSERRATKRLTVKLPVRVRLEDGREEVTRTENLSKAGVCFASGLALKEGDTLQLTVGYAPGSHEAEVRARVIWRRELEGMNRALYGVRLEEVL